MNEDLELRLIREIEEKENRIEKREEELLDNVKSLAEYFDENFMSKSKSIEVGDKRLYRYLVDEVYLNEFPVTGVLKNHVDINNVLDDILKIVQATDTKKYNTLIKYKENISIKFKYQSVFLLDIKCEGYINKVVAEYLGKNRGFRAIPYDGNIKRECKFMFNIPKGKLSFENISKSNFSELLKTDILPNKSNKTMYDLYARIKKEVLKYMKRETKITYQGTNYCLRSVEFESISLKQILVPTYLLRCADPGLDTKCVINANTRTCEN